MLQNPLKKQWILRFFVFCILTLEIEHTAVAVLKTNLHICIYLFAGKADMV